MPSDNEEGVVVVQVQQPPETNIPNLPPIRRRLLARLWATHYPPGPGVFAFAFAFGEEVMPPSTFTFIIMALLAFLQIKSQGSGPNAIKVSVTSLLLYGLATAAQLVIPADSVYAIINRLARIVFLCILIASSASFFYF